MIYFSKEMNSLIKSKKATKEELSKYLLTNLNVFELADELSDYILQDNTTQTIAVTQEEYDKITSLFRVKGQRCVDGNVIAETRGRKRAVTINPDL